MEDPVASLEKGRSFVMEVRTDIQPGFLRRVLSSGLSFALAMALVPAVALAGPQTAEAATVSPELEVTRVNTGKITLAKGMSYKLGAAATEGAKITYKSSKKSVVSVSSKGTITLNKTGKATITVTATLGKKKDTEKISVTSVKASKYVAVKKIKMSLLDSDLRVGESAKTTVAFTPKNASNKNVIYKSSNPSVLTVSSKGAVTAVGEGQATISVTSCANKKAKATLKVPVASTEEESGEQPEQPAEPEQPTEPEQPSEPDQPSQGGGIPSYPSWGGGNSGGSGDVTPSNPYVDDAGNLVDSDGDGYPDYIEKTYMGTDPFAANSQEELESKVILDKGAVKADTGNGNLISLESASVAAYLGESEESAAEGSGQQIFTATFRNAPTAQVGEVLVIDPCNEAPSGVAIKVATIEQDGDDNWVVCGLTATASETFNYLNVNDTLSLDWNNAVFAEGCGIIEDTGDNESSQVSTMSTRSLKTRGMKASVKIGVNIGESIKGYVKSEVNDIKIAVNGYKALDDIGASILFNGFKINIADVQLIGELSASVKGVVKTPDADPIKSFKLATIPAYGGLGTGVYFEIYLVNEKSGEFSVTWKCDVDQTIHYEAKKGFSQIPGDMKNSRVEFEVKAEIKVGVEFEFNIQVLTIRLANVGFGVGMKGSLSRTTHFDPVMVCDEIASHLYVEVYAELLTDVKQIDLKAEWSILNETNSPIKLTIHIEDGKYVGSECTWKPGTAGGGGSGSSGGGGGGSRPDEGNENTPSEDSGVYGDFNYVIQDGHYGYGAYATYAGEGGNVTVPERMGGQLVVTVDCSYKGLTALDVSKCSGLRELWCDHNDISTLDVTNCPNLRVLECSWNNLTSLDVSKCTMLTNLYCVSKNSVWGPTIDIAGGPRLTKLDVSKCSELREFWCCGNDLTELDLTNCSGLASLDCSQNKLSELDVTKCPSLSKLRCWDNQIATLDLSKCRFLQELFCSENKIKSLDFSQCPNLVWVNCQMQNAGNELGTTRQGCLEHLIVRGCTNLTKLICDSNSLSSLDCSGLTSLTNLDAGSNNLSALSVQGCAALKSLSCYQNQLMSLDVSDCRNLEELRCSNNAGLTSLDVSKNTQLVFLYCGWNALSTLDVSNCTLLKELSCSGNALTELVVGWCTQLEILNCTDNEIEALDVSNCQKLQELRCDDYVVVSWYQTA